jgi:hypothetical protein
MATSTACEGCAAELQYAGRGRPPKWCKRCRNAQLAEKQRRYYEQNKAELAEKQRRYREQNKAELAEKQRRYREQNKAEIAEKQRRYREQNKAEIAEKQRRYREQNKAEIAEKQRRRAGRACTQCNEHLRQPTPDGLCGFCREEAGLEAAA